MLPCSPINETLLDNYLEKGTLSHQLINNAVQVYTYNTLESELLSMKERKVYESVYSDYNKFNKMLDELQGPVKGEGAFPKRISCDEGYIIRRHITFANKYRIIITNKDFFVFISVNCDGDISKLGGKVRITDYKYEDTNGSLADITKALSYTKQYFPKKTSFS